MTVCDLLENIIYISVKGITQGNDSDSFGQYFRHIRPPLDGRDNSFSSWNIFYAWIYLLYHLPTKISLQCTTCLKYWNLNFSSWFHIKRVWWYIISHADDVSLPSTSVMIWKDVIIRFTDWTWRNLLWVSYFHAISHPVSSYYRQVAT